MGKARVVGEHFLLGLARSQQFEDEFGGEPRPANHRFASENFRIDSDALGPRHTFILSRRFLIPYRSACRRFCQTSAQ
jgi:hypothetical protein